MANIFVVVAGANGDATVNVQVKCTVLGSDQGADIAVLETHNTTDNPDTGFDFTALQKVLAFSDSTVNSPGSTIFVIGNPLGEDHNSIAQGTLRDNKYVSSSTGVGAVEGISFSAPIAPGNSGGPVLDSSMQVVGLSNYIFTGFNSFAGGVNSFMATRLVDRIMATGVTNKGFLGCSSSEIVASHVLENLRTAFPAFRNSGLDVVRGVLLSGTISNGLAAAGVLTNDILVRVNETENRPIC